MYNITKYLLFACLAVFLSHTANASDLKNLDAETLSTPLKMDNTGAQDFARVYFLTGEQPDNFVGSSTTQGYNCDKDKFKKCEGKYVGVGANCGDMWARCECPKKYRYACTKTTCNDGQYGLIPNPFNPCNYNAGDRKGKDYCTDCKCDPDIFKVTGCASPKVPEGQACSWKGTDWYTGCVCPANYQYTSANCNGQYKLAGAPCDGKYPSCECAASAVNCSYGCATTNCAGCASCNPPPPDPCEGISSSPTACPSGQRAVPNGCGGNTCEACGGLTSCSGGMQQTGSYTCGGVTYVECGDPCASYKGGDWGTSMCNSSTHDTISTGSCSGVTYYKCKAKATQSLDECSNGCVGRSTSWIRAAAFDNLCPSGKKYYFFGCIIGSSKCFNDNPGQSDCRNQ